MLRFNDLADFSRDEIKELIALAGRLDAKPEPSRARRQGAVVVVLEPVAAHAVLVPSRDACGSAAVRS